MSNASQRINGFDALRTIAMWLGIVLHAIIVYKVVPEPNWPHDTSFNSGFLDWLYTFIHFFRMPLFFMVAGFFARLVITRSGNRYFLIQRFKRIVIPFVIGCIVLLPLCHLPFHYYHFHYVEQLPAKEALQQSLKQLFHWNGLVHLWFLYYLIIFYIFSLGLAFVMKKGRIPGLDKWKEKLNSISILQLLLVTALFYILLLVFNMAIPPVNTSIRPNLGNIAYYGFFYGCGWIMQVNMKSISSLARYGWPLFIIGTGLSVFYFYNGHELQPALNFAVAAVQTISLVTGITALFIRYFTTESKVWRYFSDAAYWVYLIHIVIVVSCQVLLFGSGVPGMLRLPIVLITTFILSLLSYHYFVRYTIIGEYLHGKRVREK